MKLQSLITFETFDEVLMQPGFIDEEFIQGMFNQIPGVEISVEIIKDHCGNCSNAERSISNACIEVVDFITGEPITSTEEKESCIKCSRFFDCNHNKCKFSKINEEDNMPTCTAKDAIGFSCWCDCGSAKPVE